MLNGLAAAPHSVWLVLDDYHLVDSREVGEGMTFLLGHLPPQVHVVLSTRADPELPLSRWRGRGELQVLRLLGGELTGPQIARELFVSHNTVRGHTQHIFTKLHVTTRRAVRRARERGLL